MKKIDLEFQKLVQSRLEELSVYALEDWFYLIIFLDNLFHKDEDCKKLLEKAKKEVDNEIKRLSCGTTH